MRVIRCYVYARISSDRVGAGLGCDRQIEDCEALAVRLSNATERWEIVRVFEDNDISASTGRPRPDYLAMLRGIRDGGADAILAWHTDRLHRRPVELEEYIDVCEPRQVQTRTVKAGDLDLTTATGRMIARQLGVQARYEVERMAERAKRAKEQAAALGKWGGGRRPYGFESDGISIRPDEAAEIRRAADAILAGASLRSIVRDLDERGVLTSTGAKWQPTELRRMLERPRNAGLVKHRGKEAGPASWDAILPDPVWRAVVAALGASERRTTPSNARRWLLSGIAFCGVCGATVRVSTSGTSRDNTHLPAYRCQTGKHITRIAPVLDDYVRDLVVERLSRPDAAKLLEREEDKVDVQAAQVELLAARARLQEIGIAFGAGHLDGPAMQAASAEAKARIAKAEATIAQAATTNPLVGIAGAEDVLAEWNARDLPRQRAIVAALAIITINKAKRGRRAGFRPDSGDTYFDDSAIDVEWKKP